jgi:hypothetical protein
MIAGTDQVLALATGAPGGSRSRALLARRVRIGHKRCQMKISDQIRKAGKRQAGTGSWLERRLIQLDQELTKVAQKYTGETKFTRAQTGKLSNGVVFRVWLQLDEKATQEEALETAQTILGKGAVVKPHSLRPSLWVADHLVRLD